MSANLKVGSCDVLRGATMSLRIDYRRRRNARRYVLRVNAHGDGGSVTIPRGGCRAEARSFVHRNLVWLEERLRQWQEKNRLTAGENTILFRGETMTFASSAETEINLGGQILALHAAPGSLQSRLKAALWQLAKAELPARVSQLAAAHGLEPAVKRVAVRDQRSRWGSCSVKGVVSLNWRLIQTPEFVRDYILIHELMHLREMNHSHRFWNLVYAAFPRTDEAERWLNTHAALLRA